MIENFYSKLEVWKNSQDYVTRKNEEKQKKKELEKFISKFTLEYIDVMPIESYVTGMNNKNSFCYMIEETFKCFGKISGRTSAYQKYVIYWSEEKKDYLFGDKRTKHRRGFGSDKNEIYKNVKKEIAAIIEASFTNDYKSIAKSPLNPQFKNKIAFLYNYDMQLPIYSDDDLNMILTIFEIPFDKREDRAFKREKLFKFYKDNELDKILSTYMFMAFVYSPYGYRSILRSYEKPTLTGKISEYLLEDVKVAEVIKTKRNADGNTRKLVYNPAVEEIKRITGRKAEDIAIEYLNAHKKEMNIKTITCWCNGENHNDGKGYDISYVTNDGSEFFVEVKGTKQNLDEEVLFEMSANEHEVMRLNPNNYYIFFVNNVNEGKVIKRILGQDIEGEEPVKYRIHFKSKKY